MNPLMRVTDTVRDNFDTRVALSSLVGVAGLGVVAFILHQSNVKALKQVANIATKGSKGGK